MNKTLWQSLKMTPAFLVAGLVVNAQVQANEAVTVDTNSANIINQLDQYSAEGVTNTQGQVTSVSQLSDVSPTDWAYEALRNLVERYGCIAGYPDRTFRGNRALSRYEFAAGLNACMQQIERLVSTPGGGGVGEGDLATLKRLLGEFETELATLGARVDTLEGKVAFLEDHQFSTTTKLTGQVIVGITGTEDNQIIMGNRARLQLNTSFTGKDTLITRLGAYNFGAFDQGNTVGLVPGTSGTTTQTFSYGGLGNNVGIDWLAYYTPITLGQREINTYIAGYFGIHSDYAPTNNPFFEDYDGGNGALSTFASSNPIFRIGGGTGIGVTTPFFGNSSLSLGYLASNASNPTDGNGLFDGAYAALAQLDFGFGENFDLGVTYVRGYNTAGLPLFGYGGGDRLVGTDNANFPVGDSVAYETNSLGTQASLRLNKRISLSGFFSYTDASGGGKSANVYSYGGGVAFPDFGKEGSVLGIFAGVQPYKEQGGETKPFHLEGFYKYPINENITITPGVIYVDSSADLGESRFIGTLRTTFSF
ncbi:MAG: carbohydrate porin [Cyanobacterium sp. T60_A2020_053]|nr:carbohydrate porin [Cyanobacterium sp. T60_A2020_053]